MEVVVWLHAVDVYPAPERTCCPWVAALAKFGEAISLLSLGITPWCQTDSVTLMCELSWLLISFKKVVTNFFSLKM
jgi:hypothetical protein